MGSTPAPALGTQDVPEEQDLQLKRAFLAGFPTVTYCDSHDIYEQLCRRRRFRSITAGFCPATLAMLRRTPQWTSDHLWKIAWFSKRSRRQKLAAADVGACA